MDKSLLSCELRVTDTHVTMFRQRKAKRGPKEATVLRIDRARTPILQIGTSDPVLAVKAVTPLLPYVDQVDVNMGCPKSFSLQAGMGAALLKDAPRAASIISALKSTGKRVSCKVRLLPGPDLEAMYKATVGFVLEMKQAGLDAVTLHLRGAKESSHEVRAGGNRASLQNRGLQCMKGLCL